MKMRWRSLAPAPALLVLAPAYAADYMSVAQAQAEFFPGETLQPMPLTLDEATRKAMFAASGVHLEFDAGRVWRAPRGFFVVDEVVGKHEKIKYAVALDTRGAVKGIEVLTYSETYGGQVRNADWRAQFVGKTPADRLELGRDIRNISGATLSCKHLTQGVKRVLALYDLVLAKS
ncbi:FMN-binding protein [Mizugakiibacter sediminis]|uniref:FMN-binding protein n=2 Tax=Mizugakiibacter sediminis TaxID=1475481 RepID=A0A0K8QKK2_9GAMM|nr:FMN-binding protein [Mizugakiibacter sediminis]GAP65388.1 FMN-binding protein [Mizugakiibacter sediminis]